jgi:hypothetical protein
LAIVIDRSRSQLSGSSQEAELPIGQLADVATRVLGVKPVHANTALPFVKASPLHKARANLIVAVETLGEESLSNHAMSNLQKLRNEHHSFKLTGQSYPHSAVTVSATLATGQSPARHGIVGEGWFTAAGEKQFAYSSAATAAAVGNVADIVSQSFDGRSLTVSACSKPALAAAHAVHPRLRAAHPTWHNIAFSMKGHQFASLYPSAQTHLELSFSDIVHVLRSEGLPKLVASAQMKYNKDNTLTVTVGDASATFHLDVEESMALFAELAFADHLLYQLRHAPALSALVADNAPDAFALTFASLKGLRNKFGAASAEVKVAMRLLDQAVPALVDRFAALYNDRLVAEIVVLGGERQPFSANVIATLERVMPTEVSDAFFPAVYASQSGVDVQAVCAALRTEFSGNKEARVVCQEQKASFLSTGEQLFQTAAATAAAAPSEADIATYQIVLWSSVGLVLALALAINLLCSMENKQDTMLYSRFNPNWADRKRR